MLSVIWTLKKINHKNSLNAGVNRQKTVDLYSITALLNGRYRILNTFYKITGEAALLETAGHQLYHSRVSTIPAKLHFLGNVDLEMRWKSLLSVKMRTHFLHPNSDQHNFFKKKTLLLLIKNLLIFQTNILISTRTFMWKRKFRHKLFGKSE